jgi:hypothetical protein
MKRSSFCGFADPIKKKVNEFDAGWSRGAAGESAR